MLHTIAGLMYLAAITASDCPSAVAWKTESPPAINQGVWTYADGHMGQTVGSGECAELATAAIAAANGEPFYELGPTGLDADYVWGLHVDTIAPNASQFIDLAAGDVLQLRDTNFRHVYPDGSWASQSADHHTAIVKAISADGSQICVYQQNSDDKRYVTVGVYDLRDMYTGEIQVYSPIPL